MVVLVNQEEQPVEKITILHFNRIESLTLPQLTFLQSVLSTSYPLFKDDLGLQFRSNRTDNIGLSTFSFGFSADYGNYL